MQKFENLLPGRYYHVYNRGINGAEIFSSSEHYEWFIRMYEKYIHPICNTYAWCLMGNHFHLFIGVMEKERFPRPAKGKDPQTISETISSEDVSQAFSNLFNAYAQYFNYRMRRTGSLFESPFRRKEVSSLRQFRALVYYIHYNPVKHGFTEEMYDYPWSSFLSTIAIQGHKPGSQSVVGWFDSKKGFLDYHGQSHSWEKIESILFGP